MSNPIPEIFVMWHPSCVLGEVLARRIYAWLRPGNGLGPQVYYRSLPASNSSPNGLPSPLPGEPRAGTQGEESMRVRLTNLQIVLPLIDDHMVVDPAWREWLRQLKTQNTSKRRVIQPIALDATAYNLPAELRELNYLRPTGLPLTNAEVAIPAYAPPKVTIFLSHAKEDGRVPAQRPLEQALQDLTSRLKAACQRSPAAVVSSGLTDDETRKLLWTSDLHLAVKLVKRGLSNLGMLPSVAA